MFFSQYCIADPTEELVLVAARGTEVRWQVVKRSSLPARNRAGRPLVTQAAWVSTDQLAARLVAAGPTQEEESPEAGMLHV